MTLLGDPRETLHNNFFKTWAIHMDYKVPSVLLIISQYRFLWWEWECPLTCDADADHEEMRGHMVVTTGPTCITCHWPVTRASSVKEAEGQFDDFGPILFLLRCSVESVVGCIYIIWHMTPVWVSQGTGHLSPVSRSQMFRSRTCRVFV